MFTWILAQWEEYHTSIMLYGNSFYGVLEANYSICLIHLITGIVGPQLWQKQLVELLPMVKGTGAESYSKWLWQGHDGACLGCCCQYQHGLAGLPGPLQHLQLCACTQEVIHLHVACCSPDSE